MQNAKGFFKGSCISSRLECSTFGFLVNFEILFHLNDDDLILVIVPGVIYILVALLSGYIADNFIGRHRSAKIAFTLLFATSILQCILVVVKQSIAEVPHGLSIGLVTFTLSLGFSSADRQRLHSHYCLQLPFCSVYWW